MKLPVACLFDNPIYMRREAWNDGEIMAWWSFELLLTMRGYDARPWKDGQIIGNADAMNPKEPCA